MSQVGTDLMHGLSLHFYTVIDWSAKGSATVFDTDRYYDIVAKSMEVEELIINHKSIMDAYDPGRKVTLLLDEWGTWYDVEPGTNPGHLYQQNTMRDAMVATMSLNVFHRHQDVLCLKSVCLLQRMLKESSMSP